VPPVRPVRTFKIGVLICRREGAASATVRRSSPSRHSWLSHPRAPSRTGRSARPGCWSRTRSRTSSAVISISTWVTLSNGGPAAPSVHMAADRRQRSGGRTWQIPAGTAKPSGRACTAASARNASPAVRQVCRRVRNRRSRARAQARNRGETRANVIAARGGAPAARPTTTGGAPGSVWNAPRVAAANHPIEMAEAAISERGTGRAVASGHALAPVLDAMAAWGGSITSPVREGSEADSALPASPAMLTRSRRPRHGRSRMSRRLCRRDDQQGGGPAVA
jgi:hypothetical protein